jgi:hypothetical protein
VAQDPMQGFDELFGERSTSRAGHGRRMLSLAYA